MTAVVNFLGEFCMQNKIENYTRQKAESIDKVRRAFVKTKNKEEQFNRNEVFDTLLLVATFANIDELERYIAQMLPMDKPNATVNYIVKQLREINGICTSSFGDNHETYQDLFYSLTFPTLETKQNIRDMLSKSISDMIFEKTNAIPGNHVGIR